jgi:hypothetical protein
VIVRDVAMTLRRVAALRALCLSLPHVPTPTESALLHTFEMLARAPQSAVDGDAEAIAAGWRAWWRGGEHRRIAEMAAALPVSLVGGDRGLATYADASRRSPVRDRGPR